MIPPDPSPPHLAALRSSLRAGAALLLVLAACAPPAEPARAADAPRAFELRTAAKNALERDDPRACVKLFEEASRLAPETAGEAYDRGRCHARAGEPYASFQALGRAVDLGLVDGEQLQTDPDLSILHDDPRWQTLVTKIAAAEEAYVGSIDKELYQLYRADQADRRDAEDQADVARRDAARRARVQEIAARGGLRVSDDYFHAAMIFQHGRDVADYQRAHELALRAAELVPTHPKARWLAAAAKDREHMARGIPQLYGTQLRYEDGRWSLYPVDPTITDEERARWNVPPLAQAAAQAQARNARPR